MSKTKSALRKRRRSERETAMALIVTLDDTELKNLAHELGRELNEQANVMNDIRTRLDAVRLEKQRRDTATSLGYHISDHAVLRYLERYKGIDTQQAREEIAAMAHRAGRKSSGNQYARRPDADTGLTMGINEINNVVTTVFSERENKIFPSAGNPDEI